MEYLSSAKQKTPAGKISFPVSVVIYCKYFNGFTCEPFTIISKWTWGPVLRPVLPLRAIF